MPHHEIAIEKFGPARSLALRPRTPRPPGAGEVAIAVRYSGINFADIQMRLGFYPDAPRRPFVPGYEVSGHVEAVGAGVDGLAPGDAVVAGTYFGGYASHVTVPAFQVFPLPAGGDLAEGAALPVAFFTAHLALNEMARMRAGDKVLIECATGGVGVLAVQMARKVGAEVVGLTTTPAKKELISSLGAEALTIDEFYGDPSRRGYDVILNANGGAHVKRQLARLGLTGRMVCIGLNSGLKDGRRNYLRLAAAAVRTPRFSVLKLFDANAGVYGLNALLVLRDEAWIRTLTERIGDVHALGLRPHIGKVFPARDVAAAHELLQTRGARGKVLLAWP
jgi:2-desacetyl-2-hydroxyethyl bacteriochlorophyllide A dehydrogenase